jgi:hypothetical protein
VRPFDGSTLTTHGPSKPLRAGNASLHPLRHLRSRAAPVPDGLGAESGRTPIFVPHPGGVFSDRIVNAPSVQHLIINGRNLDRFACTCRNTSAYGLLLDNFTHTFRTVTRTNAPIFNSFNRIV